MCAETLNAQIRLEQTTLSYVIIVGVCLKQVV